MRVLQGYIAKELDNVEFLQEELTNPHRERAETVTALQESMARLGALRQLENRIKCAQKRREQRKYGHEVTPDCNGELKAEMDVASPLDQKARNWFRQRFEDNNCDAQASFMASRGLK